MLTWINVDMKVEGKKRILKRTMNRETGEKKW